MSENKSPVASHSALNLHPFRKSPSEDSGPSDPRFKVQFSVSRFSSAIEFSFTLVGGLPIDLAQIAIPELKAPAARERRDELWKKTCFEFFVAAADERAYLEFNLSPAGDWNAYAFDSYREGHRNVSDLAVVSVAHVANQNRDDRTWTGRVEVAAPSDSAGRSAGDSSGGSFRDSTKGEEGEFARLFKSRNLVLSATAVIEYGDGKIEYWALSHAGEKPDFHLRESFKLIL